MSNPSPQSPFEQGNQPYFLDGLEALREAHYPVMLAVFDKRQRAYDLDDILTHDDKTHRLTRRFVTRIPGGTDERYPFDHERVMLHSKNRSKNLGVEGMVLRFALDTTDALQQSVVNQTVVVTVGLNYGTTTEYVLSPTSWEEIADKSSLDIRDGILIGLTGGREPQPDFDRFNFNEMLDNFEPELQSISD